MGERKDHLSGASDKVATGLLVLNCTHETQDVDQHHPMGKLGFVIQTVDLTSVLRESIEGQNVIKVHAERGVDVIDQSLDALL